MDSKNGGQPFTNHSQPLSDSQRQTAARIARKKVLAAYGNSASQAADTASDVQAQVTSAQTSLTTQPLSGSQTQYTQTQHPQTAAGAPKSPQAADTHLKDQPLPPKINSESWKKYHSAWQNYYQTYYGAYYSQAARNYIEKERLKDARRQAEDQDALSAVARTKSHSGATPTTNSDIDDIGSRLKKIIRKKAVKNVKKSRRRRHWIPVLVGLAVVLLILFLQYNRLIFAPIFAYMSPGDTPATEIEAIDPTLSQNVSSDPRLIIPKLNVDVPIHFGLQLSDVMNAMNNGVAHYRIAGASAYPGEVGNTVITGHSAGDVYSSNPYKYIFSGLERLDEGDLIYVNYQSVRYTYRVTKKEVVEPSNVAALVIDTDVPMLTLVTCTPLGTSRYRLLVFAEQISPSPDGAEASDTEIFVSDDDDQALPSNEPSFFEGIWNFLTGQ